MALLSLKKLALPVFALAGQALLFPWAAATEFQTPIPRPAHIVTEEKKEIVFPKKLYVNILREVFEKDPASFPPDFPENQLSILKDMGFSPALSLCPDKDSADILLQPLPRKEKTSSGSDDRERESYSLRTFRENGKSRIVLAASAPEGFFYAWQTLAALLEQGKTASGYSLPGIALEDTPRFSWRGMHLDVSRHFFPVREVEKMLDVMALFKLNILHLHLTDGPGWRLEIKKYPELTRVGAWRVDKRDREWNWQETEFLRDGESRPSYGGFYTQRDFARLIEYAKKRNIKIIPEIDMPGHSFAALYAYGNLACKGNNVPIDGLKGKDVLCVGNPDTRQFVRDVLDELCALLPEGTPVHIGGDEVSKEAWLNCPLCREKMEREHLRTGDDLQSSFLREVMSYISGKGREVIAWDEAFGEGIREGHTVMSWRGDEWGKKAAEAGLPVVMTPSSHLYFDYYQENPGTEPKAIGGFIPLEKVFRYNPLEGLAPEAASRIRGIQSNLWTEYIQNLAHLEYMAWPRGAALAERAWNPVETDFPAFRKRLAPYLKLLDLKKVNYRPDSPRNIPSTREKTQETN